jgi:hypothetical protein
VKRMFCNCTSRNSMGSKIEEINLSCPFVMSYPAIVLRSVAVTRYVTPLREGGSLPAIAEADDGFLYVLKFRGAGQGVKSLIAELIGGEVARALGLRVPEIVFAELDAAFGRSEPDEEIQDLLKASVGLNLGLHYLSGSITYDPVVHAHSGAGPGSGMSVMDPLTASRIVWLDCLLVNVDRTARNTNMLVWNKELWLIDHGAAMYFHHSWEGWEAAALRPFVQVKDHVLLPLASELEAVDAAFRAVLTPDRLRAIVGLIPDEWLVGGPWTESPDAIRDVYTQFLVMRAGNSAIFINEALHAREAII